MLCHSDKMYSENENESKLKSNLNAVIVYTILYLLIH